MDKDVENFCKTCEGCQIVGQPDRPEPVYRREMPNKPWEHLCADFLGPLPTGENLFVVVDFYSRWIEIDIMKEITSQKVIKSLDNIFSTHGLPETIQTDNGRQFNSEEFGEYMDNLSIKHLNVTPLWPQANGQVERQNRSIMKRIRISHAQGRNWKDDLKAYLMMYRSTPHSTTGTSPAELLFGRKIRTKLPELSDYKFENLEVKDKDNEMKAKGKMYIDSRRNAVKSEVSVGDKVLVKQQKKNKLSTPFKAKPAVVVNKNGSSVEIEDSDGVKYKRNVSHVKKFHQREKQSEETVDANRSIEPGVNRSGASGENQSGEHRSIEPGGEECDNNIPEEPETNYKEVEPGETNKPITMMDTRPKRTIRLPKKFDDHVLF